MITKFDLDGFYNYIAIPGGRGNLTGELEVSSNGVFEGEIYDHASMAPEQFIQGHLKQEGGLSKMSFLKFPPSSRLANLAYILNKEAGNSFEGKYAGKWGALPYKTSFIPEYNLFIARIDLCVVGIGDSAEINLHRK